MCNVHCTATYVYKCYNSSNLFAVSQWWYLTSTSVAHTHAGCLSVCTQVMVMVWSAANALKMLYWSVVAANVSHLQCPYLVPISRCVYTSAFQHCFG